MHKASSPADPFKNEPLAEIGEILAAGLMRVLQRKSSQTSPDGGESSLDFSATESGHPAPIIPEKAR